jgi:hypothetical protein
MLNYLDVVPLLGAACTTFASSPEAAHVDPCNGEYLHIGQLAHHLIRRLDAQEVDDFACIFGVVEWILSEGDADARRLLNDGFLDDLFNPAFYEDEGCSPAGFLPWLGRRASRHRRVRALRCD